MSVLELWPVLLLIIVTTTAAPAAAVVVPYDECSWGTWRSLYQKTHNDIINGVTSPRYAIFLTPPTGFAGMAHRDQQSNHVSTSHFEPSYKTIYSCFYISFRTLLQNPLTEPLTKRGGLTRRVHGRQACWSNKQLLLRSAYQPSLASTPTVFSWSWCSRGQ